VQDVVRGKQFVQVLRGQVQRIVSFEPCAQFGRNLEALDEFVARRDRILFFRFLDDFRVALGQNVKGELPDRLRPRGGRGDARGEFQAAGGRLRGRGAGKQEDPQ